MIPSATRRINKPTGCNAFKRVINFPRTAHELLDRLGILAERKSRLIPTGCRATIRYNLHRDK
ncbi:MAG: hypothetical protein ABLQ96_10240, partial [Candidatus Acidiferrum sp.]